MVRGVGWTEPSRRVVKVDTLIWGRFGAVTPRWDLLFGDRLDGDRLYGDRPLEERFEGD